MEGDDIERDMGELVPSPVVVKAAIMGVPDETDRVIEVIEYPNAPGRPRPHDASVVDYGFTHIALLCDDVAATRADLEAKGVRFLVDGIADVAGLRTTWFADPWNNVFILVEKVRRPIGRTTGSSDYRQFGDGGSGHEPSFADADDVPDEPELLGGVEHERAADRARPPVWEKRTRSTTTSETWMSGTARVAPDKNGTSCSPSSKCATASSLGPGRRPRSGRTRDLSRSHADHPRAVFRRPAATSGVAGRRSPLRAQCARLRCRRRNGRRRPPRPT